MKNIICVLWLLLFSSQIFAQKQRAKQTTSQASEEIKISLSANHWDFQEGKIEFLEYKGVKAVRLNENSGNMIYKDLNFINGTIEFDVEVNQAQPFPTIYFHWLNKDETEHVYLR